MAKWMDEAPKTIQEINDRFEQLDVEGLQAMNDRLAQGGLSMKKFGKIVDSVLLQMVQKALAMSLQGAEVAAFQGMGPMFKAALAMMPHFAGGTDHAPGGMALVGEHGPELMNVPRGSSITPNHALRNIGRGGGVTVVQNNQFHLQGSIMANDVMEHIDRKSNEAARRGAAMGMAGARAGMPSAQDNYRKLGTG